MALASIAAVPIVVSSIVFNSVTKPDDSSAASAASAASISAWVGIIIKFYC